MVALQRATQFACAVTPIEDSVTSLADRFFRYSYLSASRNLSNNSTEGIRLADSYMKAADSMHFYEKIFRCNAL